MSDLIERQALLDAITASINQFGGRYTTDQLNMWELFSQMITELPPVTPKQRTGKCMWCERLKERNLRIEYYWIDEEGCTASFSEPHIVATGIANFCPNCGAKINQLDKTCDCYSDGRCVGTKEIDPCSCGGHKSKCDFYENVRQEGDAE